MVMFEEGRGALTSFRQKERKENGSETNKISSSSTKITTTTMATKAIIGRGLREAGAALKHSSGMEVGDNCLL
jgi:hypothetical protein